MLLKNAIQKIHVYAYDSTTGAAKTGDAANITAYVSLDGTANAIDDTNPAEVDATNMPGVYVFDLTAAETNCDSFALYAKSATSNIRIEPIIGFTTAGTSTSLSANAIAIAANAITATAIQDGAITAAKLNTGAITADAFAANAITNAAVADDVDVNVKTITAGAITAAAIAASALNNKGNWNIGKTGYSMTGTLTTLDALNTSLSSTHGSASWATATGFSTHSASDVVTALGTGSTLTALATATAVADVPTVAEFEARTLAAASYGTAANQTTIIGYVDCLPSAWVTVPTAIENADALLIRSVATAEETAPKYSLCTLVLAALNSSVSGTTRTIRKSTGTTYVTQTVTVDADADPITGVS